MNTATLSIKLYAFILNIEIKLRRTQYFYGNFNCWCHRQQHIFLLKQFLETFYQLIPGHWRWITTLGCMACFTAYLIDIFCMAALALAGIKSEKPEKILWPYISNHVHMECICNLVDMECFSTRCSVCFPG